VLEPGDPAPDVRLLDQHGEELDFASLRGRDVLLFFYPKANTPGCTTQACGLRDIDGAAIVGVSPDPPRKQLKFDEDHSLGYPLLADEDHAVAEAFGVWGEKKLYGKTYLGVIRSAFLIGADGTIRETFYEVSPKDTPKKLLKALAA
jgi:peroxiredoxin Q/BCP